MSPLSQEQVTDPGDPLVAELVASLLPDSRLVRTPVGFLWLGPDGEYTPVLDVGADDPADVPALRDLRRRRQLPSGGHEHAT